MTDSPTNERPSLASRRISYDSNMPAKKANGLSSPLSLGTLPSPAPTQPPSAGQRSVPAREPNNAFAQTVEEIVQTPGVSPVNNLGPWASPDKATAASQLWADTVDVSPKKAVASDLELAALPRAASFASALDYRRGSETTTGTAPSSSNPSTSPASSRRDSTFDGSGIYSPGSPRKQQQVQHQQNGNGDLDGLAAGFRNMRVASSTQAPTWAPVPQRNQYIDQQQAYMGGFYAQAQPELVAAAAAAVGGTPYYDYTWAASPTMYQGGQGIRRAQSSWQVGAGMPGLGLGIDRSPSRSPVQTFSPRQYYSPDPYGSPIVDFSRTVTPNGLVGNGLVNPYGYGSPLIPAGLPGPPGQIRVIRSPLLEDFRNNRHRRWELAELQGHVCEFANDQLGSRHIQTKLDTCTMEERAMVFNEILPAVLQLSTDTFGNYVCQKLFEVANLEQKGQLVDAFRGNVLRLSLQSYACRVVQKAIEQVPLEQQVHLISELDGHVLKCARDQNANHTLQKVVATIPSERIQFIADACIGQVFALATHPYGCRVLQRILENMRNIQPLVDELIKYAVNLIQDQYGNYLAQHLLEHGPPAARSAIISRIKGQLPHLARHKFASNVVDKAILTASEQERQELAEEVLYDPSVVGALLRDPFGNYCLQKLLLTTNEPQRTILVERTRDALDHLKLYSNAPLSKHLIAIEKYMMLHL